MSMRHDRKVANHLLIVDGHVHIHDCYDLERFFEAAYLNFWTQANRVGQSDSYSGLMLLAERFADRWFERLNELADAPPSTDSRAKPLTFHRIPEDSRLLLVRRGNSEGPFVVAGRQILSSEGVEVLALTTTKVLPDGLPAREIILEVRKEGALPVLPWGFGKWLGRRGSVIKNLLQSELRGMFFLGDNGGRPVFWGTPSHFKIARSMGVKILPGTDPLPLTWEARRVGSFGFTLGCKLTRTFSLQRDLIEPLRTKDCIIGSYGNLLHGLDFVRNQIGLKIPRHSPGGASHRQPIS